MPKHPARPTGKITIAEAKDALKRSGYPLEGRVADVFRDRGYLAELNQIYPDPDTRKMREFDVSALQAIPAGPDELDFLFPKFLVECVNNPQPIAFFTKESEIAFLHHEDIKFSGLPVKILGDDGWTKLSEFLGMRKYHHYCSGPVATQFCSFHKKQGKGQEWMATHDDTHFSSLKTLCDVVEYKIEEHFSSWVFDEKEKEKLNIQMYYPLLVVQGDLLQARVRPRSVQLSSKKHIQFRRSILSGTKEHSYQIDVVTEGHLKRYLDQCEKEIAKTARLLHRRHGKIREAINKIVAEVLDTKDSSNPRKTMDF